MNKQTKIGLGIAGALVVGVLTFLGIKKSKNVEVDSNIEENQIENNEE